MTTSSRQLDRDIRRSLTRSLRRWNVYGRNPFGPSKAKRRYDRMLPEGKYEIYPISSAEGKHLGYQLSFAEMRPYRFRMLGVYSSPEEAAIAAAEHYAEL